MAMLDEFKKFAMRGNVVDLAVGVVIGGAFGKITSSFVNDILTPPLGLMLGGVDFSNLAITLKAAEDFTRIGRRTRRVDSEAKVRGTAMFGLDQRAPGMLTALVARSPYFGGRLKSYDDHAARSTPGVKAIVQVPSGIAVVADGYWPAFKARAALVTEWEPGPGGTIDSTRLRAETTIIQ